MPSFYTPDNIGARIKERGLKPGDRLWAAGDKIDSDAYRLGNSDKNPAVYLRWRDIGIERKGKIESEEDMNTHTVSPGQGLSLFIERIVHSDFNYITTRQGKAGKAVLRELAQESGYDSAAQMHWFTLEQGKVIPAGLVVKFDNEPPGHCTLTVTHTMTVKNFLTFINTHLNFKYVGTDIFGIK